MSFPDWRDPARLLEAATCAVATDEQRELAEKIDLPLTGSEPRAVVAAMLEDHLHRSLTSQNASASRVRRLALLRRWSQFWSHLGLGPHA